MTQLSRPYQIALVTMALFVGVWFLALRGHTTTPEAGSSATPAPATAVVQTPAAPAKATPAAKAPASVSSPRHGATAAKHTTATKHTTAAKHAGAAKHNGAAATGTAAAKGAATTGATAAKGAAKAKTHAAGSGHAVAAAPKQTVPAPAAKHTAPVTALSPQASVEAQLKQGKLVAILFTNPHGSVDGVVSGELAKVARTLKGRLAVHLASASEVGAFGSITRDVQVNQTPTLLILTKTGSTVVITGLTDAFSIEQSIEELHS